ncbi:MAG: M20/M25/M40 family metallo-hydrolase, partial [Nannocystaceae bacterium]
MRWRPGPHLLVLVACLVAGALALVTTALPRPRPVTAPANVFSAERAAATIRALLGDGAPHPVGSPANDAVRERLVATLEGMGLAPELQRAFMCQPWGVCAWVTNVVVELPGAAEVPAIALSAHYDSVSAGPGAADDLQGVATLVEGLRALKELRGRDGPPHRPLVAVFTDGEEVGLLGALAFTEHPRFADVGVVINAEARGTGGRPQMFEASAGNHRLIGAVAQARHLPLTTSLAYEIYRRMPNDT